jgi:hypothetical protein
MADPEGMDPTRLARRSVLTFVGLAGTSGALTVMFLSMRSVMDIGGVCASGNTAFQPRHPCPTGVAGSMVGAIFLGLIFLAIYALNVVGPNLTLLAWPALFLSLGFNFFDYGISPPGGGGLVFGWLLCGVMFALMGGIPLIFAVHALVTGRQTRMKPDVDSFTNRVAARTRWGGGSGSNDELRRIETMHRAGQLTDDEYEASKLAIQRKEQLK